MELKSPEMKMRIKNIQNVWFNRPSTQGIWRRNRIVEAYCRHKNVESNLKQIILDLKTTKHRCKQLDTNWRKIQSSVFSSFRRIGNGLGHKSWCRHIDARICNKSTNNVLSWIEMEAFVQSGRLFSNENAIRIRALTLSKNKISSDENAKKPVRKLRVLSQLTD